MIWGVAAIGLLKGPLHAPLKKRIADRLKGEPAILDVARSVETGRITRDVPQKIDMCKQGLLYT